MGEARVVETLACVRPRAGGSGVLAAPDDFYAVGVWYDDFRQVTDQEVSSLLALARPERAVSWHQPQMR